MSSADEYRYSPDPTAWACPQHPHCLIRRCTRWQCTNTFHTPINQPGQPRRYCTNTCRVAEHRRLST